MTSPPRLAPLETMTEERYKFVTLQASDAFGHSLGLYLAPLIAELDAQRLARARARREALEEVAAKVATKSIAGMSATSALSWVLSEIAALRDREEA